MAAEILIVDDEADIRMLIGGILADEGYETRDAGDSAAARAYRRSDALARRSASTRSMSPASTLTALPQMRREVGLPRR